MMRRFGRIQLASMQPIGSPKQSEASGMEVGLPDLGGKLPETGRQPLALFSPASYEAKYPYPLLVWLFGEGVDETALLRLMPKVSKRNFAAVGLPGSALAPRPGLADAAAEEFDLHAERQDREVDLFSAVRFAGRRMHVHSERIFLVGVGDGATRALECGLAHPDCFAGIAALDGSFPPSTVRPLADWRRARRIPVFLAHSAVDAREREVASDRTRRLLYTAGFSVESHLFPGPELSPRILAQLNQWIMGQLA